MENVVIPDVPEEVQAELQRRATMRGQSLEHYLLDQLHRLAGQSDLADGSETRGGRVGLTQAVRDLHGSRDER